MNERLRADLVQRISERHQKWIEDSADLYNMAELPRRCAIADIFTVIVASIATGATQFKVSEDIVVGMIHEAMELKKQFEAQK